jgi:predicted permease
VALSLTLLAATALFLRSAGAEAAVDPGFDASERVLALSFDLGMQGYTDARAEAFVRAASERARALPGVTAVSVTDQVPLAMYLNAAEALPEAAPGARPVAEGRGAEVVRVAVRPGFFAALDIPLVRGRDVSASDAPGAPGVAVVSERLARQLWPGEDPLGRRLSVAGARGPWLTVVGVAREALFEPTAENSHAVVYVAQAQHPGALGLTLLVRAEDDARPLAAPLRRELRALDPDLPLVPVQTLAAYRRARLVETRFWTGLMGFFGGLALLLAAAGVYGVAAYAVAQRTREIGVRMALGARARDVVALFVRQALWRVAAGGAVGLVLAIAVARLLGSVLYGVGSFDALSLAGAAGVMTLAAVTASWLPARRAARVDPVVALRADD